MSIFCIEKGELLISASMPTVSTLPFPEAFTLGVLTTTDPVYSPVVLYSAIPYSAGTPLPKTNACFV